MACPNQNNVTMTRGDTTKWYFQRKDNDGNVITTRPSKLYFTVKSDPRNLTPVFQIQFPEMTLDEDGTIHFTILPSMTNGLDWRKQYYYDIEVIDAGVKTTISYGRFTLKPEVTWAQNEEGESE